MAVQKILKELGLGPGFFLISLLRWIVRVYSQIRVLPQKMHTNGSLIANANFRI